MAKIYYPKLTSITRDAVIEYTRKTIDISGEIKRVVVAMSGGVDSSVAAAMLHAAGYEVIGVTLQLYDHGQMIQKAKACCAGRDIYDAKNVAEKLGIKHYVLNYESRFREAVIDQFADSYLHGETPLPCVRCNQDVKFDDLYTQAKQLGADALVTGHYINNIYDDTAREYRILRGLEDKRDQSYFLFSIQHGHKDFLRFPIGFLKKEQVRAIAELFELGVANKPDSQDICFVPDGDYAKLIKKLRPDAERTGALIHIGTGEQLGTHHGIVHYTIGQRKGLGIAWENPLYVIKMDPKHNIIYVGEKHFLATRIIPIQTLNWLGNANMLHIGQAIQVKIRSTQNPIDARIHTIDEEDNTAQIELVDDEFGVSPGQACVMYRQDEMIGGGWISRMHKK